MTFTAHSNLCDVVADHAAKFPSRPAAIFVRGPGQGEADELSYAQLAGRAWLLADWLRSRLAPGSRVMIALPPGLDWVTAFTGCLAAGMIAVPAPVPTTYANARRRTAGVIRDSGTTMVLTSSQDLADVTEWAAENDLSGVACSALPDMGEACAPPPAAGRGPCPDSLAFLQYTSGSTGDPKGVMVSNGNIAANAELFCRQLGMDAATRFGGWIPFHHDMGLITLLCVPLLLGSTTAIMPASAFLRRPVDWLRAIDRYGINMSAAPNFAYDQCTRAVTDEQAAALDLSAWRWAINGSEPVHVPIMEAFARKFAASGFRPGAMLPGYGMAEATVFVSCRRPGAPLKPLAADPEQGRLTPDLTRGAAVVSHGIPQGFDVRIVHPQTREVAPDGSIGEIWLRGTSVAQGYWQRQGSTDATFRATTADGETGWLRTGDLGALLDGEIYITGRLKEMLVIRGRNLFPQDLEQEARAVHPALRGLVGAAFAVAAPDERAVIVHEVNVRAADAELPRIATAIKARLTETFAIPARNVVLVRRGTIRRTTSGKIERVATRQLFFEGSLRAAHTDLEPAVARLIRRQELAGAGAPAGTGGAA